MLVSRWMTSRVITLTPDTSLKAAVEIMRRQGVRRLPVIDSFRNPVGILSDRDIRDVLPSKHFSGDNGHGDLSDLQVEDIMTRDPLCVTADTSMEVVAQMLGELRIGGLPVKDESGALTGIVTEVDVFRFLGALMGTGRGGVQFVFRTGDSPAEEEQVLAAIRQAGFDILSTCVSTELGDPGERYMAVRIAGASPAELDAAVHPLKERFNLLYQVRGEDTVL